MIGLTMKAIRIAPSPRDLTSHKIFQLFWRDSQNDVATNDLGISSHWSKYLSQSYVKYNNFDYEVKIEGLASFLTFSKLNRVKYLFLELQLYILGKLHGVRLRDLLFFSRQLHTVGRLLDFDVVKHFIIEAKLSHYLKFEKKQICVIGDGWGNFGQILKYLHPSSNITFLNLGENLFFDSLMTNKLFPCLKHNFENIHKLDELNFDFNYTTNKESLKDSKFDLILNVASFSEMNLDTIQEYFAWIGGHLNSGGYFYHCNRESKILPDGSRISIQEFQSELLYANMIFSENCHWYSRYPTGRIPLFKPFDGIFREFLYKSN
jgi:hypothetical protein